MADGQAPKKKSLFGWLKDALESVAEDLPATPDEQPAATSAPGTGSLKPGSGPLPTGSGPLKPGSGPLKTASGPLKPGTDQFTRSATPVTERRAPSTGQLRPASSPLGAPRPGSTPLPPRPEKPQLSPEEQEAESEKRMAFIVDYLDDPESDEMFQDKQLVYQILSEERTYQQQLVGRLSVELRRLNLAAMPDDEDDEPVDPEIEEKREELMDRIESAKRRQTQLFVLMKELMGVKGKTGGTGWLSQPAADTES